MPGPTHRGAVVEEATERLAVFTRRDAEFARRFGRWQRPDFMPRYDLERLQALVRWHPDQVGVLDIEPLLRMLRCREDRKIAGEIARFVAEEFVDAPATDKTLGLFRLHLLRRLDACGF